MRVALGISLVSFVVGCTFDADKLRTPGGAASDAASNPLDGAAGSPSPTGGVSGTGGALYTLDSGVGGAGGTSISIPVGDAGRDGAEVEIGGTFEVRTNSPDGADVSVPGDASESLVFDVLRDADSEGLRPEVPSSEAGPEAGFEAGREAPAEASQEIGREAGPEAGPEAPVDTRPACPAYCSGGCYLGCDAEGKCQACATCTCSGETGICHC